MDRRSFLRASGVAAGVSVASTAALDAANAAPAPAAPKPKPIEVKAPKGAVEITDGRCLLEASGGLTLERARAVGETGVDLISVGALTHSVTVFDIGMDLRS